MIKRVDNGGQVHLVTNIRKPRKWRRYEYLLSNGTLYIDTGIKLSLTDKFEFETDFTYSPANNKACPFYGTADYKTGFMAQYHYTNNTLYVVYIKGTLFGNANVPMTASSRMYSKTVIDVPNKAWATIYNTTSANGKYSNLITDTTSTVKFFGNDLYSKYVAKCYYFKIKRNNILIRHFVPAQYNGQYGMWDLVEDKFYKNAGTGTFTVGPEVKNYDEIYEVRKTSSLLPAGVELYDYILSSGTLWIDTGTKANLYPFKLDIEFMSHTSSGEKDVWGNINSSLGDKYGFVSGVIRQTFFQWGGSVWSKTGATVNQWHVVTYEYPDANNRNMIADGTSYTVAISNNNIILSNSNIYLFSDGPRGSMKFNGKIKYAKIYVGNVLKRNMLPCTYLGEPGMWDTVENKFYRNQGTGLFTLGNKITLKEYEYLKTNAANQSIYTGIYLADNHSIAYDIIFKYENNGVRRLMGPSGSSGSYFGANSNGKYDRYSSISIGNIDHLYEEFNLITKKLVAYINDFKYRENSITAAASIGNCYIFSLNGATNYTGAGQYFYSGKMIYDGKVIRDFIPVSYNGTPGLWDKVEWKFYANVGSGSFTLGPEKASGVYPVRRTLIDELLFTFRQTAGGQKVMKPIAKLNSIKGNSIVWNLLVNRGNARTQTSNNITMTVDANGSITLNGTASAQAQFNFSGVSAVKNHKYAIITKGINNNVYINWDFVTAHYITGNEIYTSTKDEARPLKLRVKANNSVDNLDVKFNIIDLTIMFGAGNEPTTVAQFEADYFKWFGQPLDYEPYDPGSIRNTKANTLKSVGFNQWDGVYDAGKCFREGGVIDTSYNVLAITDFIPALPNKLYFITISDGSSTYLCFYDTNKNYIGGKKHTSGSLLTVTTPSGTAYIRDCLYISHISSYCINLSDSNLNGIYKSYNEQTYSIPITSITGKLNGSGNSVIVFPEGMKSVGSVHDEIVVEGGVTKAIKRIGSINNLGNSNWYKVERDSFNIFLLDIYNIKHDRNRYNYKCLKYLTVNYLNVWNGRTDKSISEKEGVSSSSGVMIYDSTYSNSSVTDFKAAMQGVMLYYELATPQEYILDNFSLPLDIKVERGGTEEIISTDTTSVGPTLLTEYTL